MANVSRILNAPIAALLLPLAAVAGANLPLLD